MYKVISPEYSKLDFMIDFISNSAQMLKVRSMNFNRTFYIEKRFGDYNVKFSVTNAGEILPANYATTIYKDNSFIMHIEVYLLGDKYSKRNTSYTLDLSKSCFIGRHTTTAVCQSNVFDIRQQVPNKVLSDEEYFQHTLMFELPSHETLNKIHRLTLMDMDMYFKVGGITEFSEKFTEDMYKEMNRTISEITYEALM